MSIQLIVNGNDLSDYVVSSDRMTSICNPIGSLDVLLSPNLPFTIMPYEEVTFYENGTKVFTGYTDDIVLARMPVEKTLTCMDPLVRARACWFAEEYTSTGNNVGEWVSRFLGLAGIFDVSLDAGGAYFVQEGVTWQNQTVLDAITQTLKMSPLQIYADANGTIHLAELRKGSPSYIISEYIEYERTRNDSWLRNRAVVMGHGFQAEETRSNPLLPGEIRTVVIATGMIYNLATAYRLVDEMLDEFENPLDVKVVTVPGNPNYAIGQTIHLTDTWSGYDENCMVTGIHSIYNAETYQTEVTLDEKCVNFWGWDRPPLEYQIFYCGTWGRGVWRSSNTAQSWDPTNLGNKYVYDIHWGTTHPILINGILWAACKDGVYKTIDEGDTWTTMSLGGPTDVVAGEGITLADLYFVGVTSDDNDARNVFVLAGEPGNRGIWVYYSTSEGSSWSNVRIR